MQPNTTIDPTIKALVSAIGEAETGSSSPDAYTKRGASGEYGRYQFMPDTWKAYSAKAGVTTPLERASIEEQNKVAYSKIKEWKDAGYNPAQIASMWNAGPGKPNAYKEGWKGVNSQGVAYDTPAYAQKVSEAYQRLKGQTASAISPDQPMPQAETTLMGDIGRTASEAGGDLATAIGKGVSGEINPLSSILQSGGALAEGALGTIGDIIHHTPVVKDIVKGVGDVSESLVQGALDTEAGQKGVAYAQKFAQEHPEASGNIGAAVDIASAVPVFKGIGLVKNKIAGGIDSALHGSKDAVLETVSKPLTPKKMAEAVATRGTVTRGLLRDVDIAPNPFEVKIANTIKREVPDFSPDKSLLYNIGVTQSRVNQLNNQIKAKVKELGADRIYSYRELGASLNNIERPLLVTSDATLNNAYNRVISKAMEIAKKKGGKVSNLLDVRQEFDVFIKRQFPNLYSSENLTPMRQAVGDIRDALTDFTVKNLPEGTGLKETLTTEHLLIKAIENMSVKATKGASKELGVSAGAKFGQKHPVITGLAKTGAAATGAGLGLGGAMNVLN